MVLDLLFSVALSGLGEEALSLVEGELRLVVRVLFRTVVGRVGLRDAGDAGFRPREAGSGFDPCCPLTIDEPMQLWWFTT